MAIDVKQWVDGNGLAGTMGELFAGDLTAAVGRCAHCGRDGMLAEAHVFDRAPGLVARCTGCGEVLMRVVRSPDRAWLDMSGFSVLEIPMPSE